MQPLEREFKFEGFTLDLRRGCLRGAGGEIELRPKSFEVLRYLVENAGRLVPKDELIKAVWPNLVVTDESLTRCVSDVRLALGDRSQQIIRTVPRRGYLLAVPTREAEADATSSDPVAAGFSFIPDPEPTSEKTSGVASVDYSAAQRDRSGAALLKRAGAEQEATAVYDPDAGRSLRVPDKPSLAVLPFHNLSGDPDQEYFADGVVEEIITALSRIRWLFVIAPNSSFTFKGGTPSEG
jgi:adenylate cyclase